MTVAGNKVTTDSLGRVPVRHPITVGREVPAFSAIAVFATPSAASSTIRARCARPARTDVDRVNRASSSRSPSRNAKAAAGRFAISIWSPFRQP